MLADVATAARNIERDGVVFGVRAATGRATPHGGALLELTLDPQEALVKDGFEPERVRISILRDQQAFTYVRSNRDRPVKHRNLAPSRSLCLFYDQDNSALRWLPEDGLGEYLTIVHRHLLFEEVWRRTNDWPCEDAPHGQAASGEPHPVATREMRALARRWARPAV